jgi:hypothetical protein
MDTKNLSFDMQTQRAGIDRQRALYEALFARMATPQMPQNKGRMESRIQPLQMLIQGLGAYMGHKKLQGLNEQEQQWGRQASEMQSQQAKQAQQQAMIKALTDAVGSRTAPQALYDMHTQQNPAAINGQFHQPGIAGANIDGMPGVMTTKPTGEQSFSHRPVGTTVTVGGEKEAASVRGDVRGELLKEKEKLVRNPQAIRLAAEAQSMIDQGAQTGGGQTIFQGLREFADALGVEIPETGVNQALLANLENRAISRAREVYPVTDKDLDAIRKMVGNINTVEGALRYLTALDAAAAYAGMFEYNAKVDNLTAGVDDPAARAAYEHLKMRIPPQLPMPALAGQILQMWGIPVMVEGGDGQPTPARFNLQSELRGPANAAPAAAQPPGRIRRRTQ